MESFLFFLFSTVTLFCCFSVAFLATPVNAVFYLVLAFCNSAALLILAEAEFLSLLFLIVYVGAIAVLFLFVIIILNLKETFVKNTFFFSKDNYQTFFIVVFIFFIVFLQLVFLFSSDFVSFNKNFIFNIVDYTEWVFYFDFFSNVNLFGQILYSYFFFYFLVAGFVLIVAMLSSVVLTSQKKLIGIMDKRQFVALQLSRSISNAVFLVKRSLFRNAYGFL